MRIRWRSTVPIVGPRSQPSPIRRHRAAAPCQEPAAGAADRDMTWFDGAVAVLVVLAAAVGWRLGLARVVFPLVAAGLVLWLSATYADQLTVAHTSPSQVVVRGWLTVAAFVLAPLLAAM